MVFFLENSAIVLESGLVKCGMVIAGAVAKKLNVPYRSAKVCALGINQEV